jgi:hypothetical protein
MKIGKTLKISDAFKLEYRLAQRFMVIYFHFFIFFFIFLKT